MNLIEKINKISEEAKNQFKPDLKKYGKNFRTISESAVLEVLNPLFKRENITYDVIIVDKELRLEKIRAGLDATGNLIEKLVFVANCTVSLVVRGSEGEERVIMQGWGSGVDAGDKATGKAITAAVKYALFKGFRLQYSDDPDADASEDIESVILPENLIKGAKAVGNFNKKMIKSEEEPLATEAQINYIKGLAIACGISDEDIKSKYGFFPYETSMPMKKAREIIDELKKLQDEKLPF